MRQRTVRYAAANCPQLNLASLPELPTFLDKFQTILQTVRDPVADCPQFIYANPPKTTMFLDKTLNLLADCPPRCAGPSALQPKQVLIAIKLVEAS